MAKLLYKPLGMLMGALGGLVATSLFRRTWKLVAHQDEAPKPAQRGRTWREVLSAAAMQGAIVGLVHAAVDRAGAKGFEKATGAWPS
ncbi:MAG TPA: DUF4235 domain-containing protein [Acidimicrobiales bacterium]|nr:DUF4235 domain-containing protein [Acidimicrobiales bacterium]